MYGMFKIGFLLDYVNIFFIGKDIVLFKYYMIKKW